MLFLTKEIVLHSTC